VLLFRVSRIELRNKCLKKAKGTNDFNLKKEEKN
jgi:hypothetical protein